MATASDDTAAVFAEQLLAKHATAAEHAADVAAGLSPNSSAAAEYRAALAAATATTPHNAATEIMRSTRAREESNEVEVEEGVSSGLWLKLEEAGHKVHQQEEAGKTVKKAPEEQIRSLASVIASIHAQAQELMWQLGLLHRGAALAQSKVGLADTASVTLP